jgi:hypothetical protein
MWFATLLLLPTALCMCLGGTEMNDSTGTVLFVPATSGYVMQWANSQRDSNVPFELRGSGHLQWKLPYDSFGASDRITPLFVLAADGHIAVQAQDYLMLAGADGKAGARIGINGLFPVVVGNNAFAYEDFSDQLAYQTYDGTYLVEGHQVPLMKERTYLPLLEPFGDGAVCAVQYMGGFEDPADPARFYACRFKLGTAFWEWMVQDIGYLITALLTPDGSQLVIVRNDHVEIYKVDNGAKTASFETGFARTLVGSLDQEGRLVLIGQGEDEAAGYSELKVFDPEGKLLWSMALQEREFKQPPVCGSDGMVYLINMNAVQAIRDSNVVWQNSTVNGAPLWLTAAGNGEVVAVESEGVTVFAADGSRRIDIPAGDVEDQFVTPAAIDSAGRILVAGEKALYCFD